MTVTLRQVLFQTHNLYMIKDAVPATCSMSHVTCHNDIYEIHVPLALIWCNFWHIMGHYIQFFPLSRLNRTSVRDCDKFVILQRTGGVRQTKHTTYNPFWPTWTTVHLPFLSLYFNHQLTDRFSLLGQGLVASARRDIHWFDSVTSNFGSVLFGIILLQVRILSPISWHMLMYLWLAWPVSWTKKSITSSSTVVR